MHIAVVIPTQGRALLAQAVASVLAQTLVAREVVVVVDGDDIGSVADLLPENDALRVISTGGRRGGNVARMQGVAATTSEFVAFLDDDDTWHPNKLAEQARMIETVTSPHVVASCRVELVDAHGRATGCVWPRRLLKPGQAVGDYLFQRREIRHGEALLHTSTLLCDRSLLELVPWQAGLVRHQDWNWVLDVDRPDVAFVMHDAPLVVVNEVPASLSRSNGWSASVAWVEQQRDRLSRRQVGDLLLAHTAPLAALETRRASIGVAEKALRWGMPGLPAWIFFLAQLLVPVRHLTPFARAVQGHRDRR